MNIEIRNKRIRVAGYIQEDIIGAIISIGEEINIQAVADMWNEVRLCRDRGRCRDHINEVLSQISMSIGLRPLEGWRYLSRTLKGVDIYRRERHSPAHLVCSHNIIHDEAQYGDKENYVHPLPEIARSGW